MVKNIFKAEKVKEFTVTLKDFKTFKECVVVIFTVQIVAARINSKTFREAAFINFTKLMLLSNICGLNVE